MSVQRLLFDARDDPFASYYPNLAANASSWRESFRPFKKFCLANEEALTRSLRSRRVQTNEVNRCCFLYPLFSWAQEKWGGRPLALIELGASAGLNLALDQYRYEVPEVGRFGHEGSTVTLRSGFHGFDKNRYKLRPLDIEKRIGIDLAPLDLGCEEDKTWLEALVWPEQSERRENLKRAIPIARSSGVKVLKGDAAELLAQATAEVGLGTTLVVFHTCVANQMSGARKKALAEALESVSKRRDLFYLHNNIRDGICLDWSKGARWKRSVAGKADTHGRWVDWGWRE